MPSGIYKRTEKHKQAMKDRAPRIGSNAPSWKGGKFQRSDGYVYLRVNGGYILEHRHIMALYIGRSLTRNEVVDHINAIKNDNRIENLRLFSNQGEHIRTEHKRGRYKEHLAKLAEMPRERNEKGQIINGN